MHPSSCLISRRNIQQKERCYIAVQINFRWGFLVCWFFEAYFFLDRPTTLVNSTKLTWICTYYACKPLYFLKKFACLFYVYDWLSGVSEPGRALAEKKWQYTKLCKCLDYEKSFSLVLWWYMYVKLKAGEVNKINWANNTDIFFTNKAELYFWKSEIINSRQIFVFGHVSSASKLAVCKSGNWNDDVMWSLWHGIPKIDILGSSDLYAKLYLPGCILLQGRINRWGWINSYGI